MLQHGLTYTGCLHTENDHVGANEEGYCAYNSCSSYMPYKYSYSVSNSHLDRIRKLIYNNIKLRSLKSPKDIPYYKPQFAEKVVDKKNVEGYTHMSEGLQKLRGHAKTRNYRREINEKAVRVKAISKKAINPRTKNPKGTSKITDNGTFSVCTWQQDSLQDFSWMNSELGYILVCDGHGENMFINWFRSLTDNDFNQAFESDCPIRHIEMLLKQSRIYTETSGGCITTMKISPTSIEISSVGDSQARVYVNGDIKAVTDEHTAFNPVEKERKKRDGAKFKDELMMRCLKPGPNGELRLTKEMGTRIIHNPLAYNKDYCQLSRAAGHAKSGCDSNTGTIVCKCVINFETTDEVVAISGSDGIWDLVHETENVSHYKNASKITVDYCNKWYSQYDLVHWDSHNCDMCKERRLKGLTEPVTTKMYGILADDICAGVWYRPGINQF